MAKTRHEPESSSNKGAMALMGVGGLAVGALVVWALTRTVEVTPTTTSTATTVSAPADATPVPSTYSAADGRVPAPSQVPPGAIATSTAAPHPPEVHGDRSSVQRIAVEDLRAKMDRNEVTVIDVRDANSYNAKHIAGAINVPFASVESMLGDIPKDKPIVTYCT